MRRSASGASGRRPLSSAAVTDVGWTPMALATRRMVSPTSKQSPAALATWEVNTVVEGLGMLNYPQL